MELAINILLSLVLAIVVTILLVLILDRRHIPRGSFGFYFPIVFIFITASQLWWQGAAGETTAALTLAPLVASAIVLLTAIAFHPRRRAFLRLLSSDTRATAPRELATVRDSRVGQSFRLPSDGYVVLYWLLVTALLAGVVTIHAMRG